MLQAWETLKKCCEAGKESRIRCVSKTLKVQSNLQFRCYGSLFANFQLAEVPMKYSNFKINLLLIYFTTTLLKLLVNTIASILSAVLQTAMFYITLNITVKTIEDILHNECLALNNKNNIRNLLFKSAYFIEIKWCFANETFFTIHDGLL